MNRRNGFTLLEILLVVAAISILAGIVIIALNPAKQLGETRNAQRFSDLDAVLEAAWQYNIDNGSLPSSINNDTCPGSTFTEICKSSISTSTCSSSNLVNLKVLTHNTTYLTSLPIDPSDDGTGNGTGYHIVTTDDDRVQVCAPDAELSTTISLIR